MRRRVATPDPFTVVGPGKESFTVVAQPSGVIGWQYEASALPDGIPVAIAGALWNVLGRMVFRFGWSVVVYDETDRRIGRRRFPSKRAAVAFMPRMAEDLRQTGVQSLRTRPSTSPAPSPPDG
jgi:sugar lactone lactonase YvrE